MYRRGKSFKHILELSYKGLENTTYELYRSRVGPSSPFKLKADRRNTYHLDTKTCFSLFESFDFFRSGWLSGNGAFLFKGELAIFKTPSTCDVLNFELVTVHCFSVSGNDHFRHHVLRCTSIEITWYKFPPLSLFLLGTSCLVRKASLSHKKPLPLGQRVKRPRNNGLWLITNCNMANDGVLSGRKDRDREIQLMEREESVQILFTTVALGKFIDQNDEVVYFTR